MNDSRLILDQFVLFWPEVKELGEAPVLLRCLKLELKWEAIFFHCRFFLPDAAQGAIAARQSFPAFRFVGSAAKGGKFHYYSCQTYLKKGKTPAAEGWSTKKGSRARC
jgi:hypothetical protein